MSGNKLVLQTTLHRGDSFSLDGRTAALFFSDGRLMGVYTHININDGDLYAWMPEVEGAKPLPEFKQGDWVTNIETGEVFLITKEGSVLEDGEWFILHKKGLSGNLACPSFRELQTEYKHVDT